jgi:Ser/Thr protein kinase RdoA (MazF antagonist)
MKSVGAVFDEPESRSVLKVWQQSEWGDELFDRELAVLQHLSSRGLTPELMAHGQSGELAWIRCRRLRPLTDWLVGATSAERVSMGHRLIEQVFAMHETGVCHRDLQMMNVVLDDNAIPLFIDLEISEWSDPGRPCYDLDGPGDLDIPGVHHDIGLHDGVWWDVPWPPYDVFGATSQAPPPYVGAVFGPSVLYR